LKKTIWVITIFLLTISVVTRGICSEIDLLIPALENGEKSPELFRLLTGVNEFDLLYVEGQYHLFYDDKIQTKYRKATTIGGLSAAADELTIAGNYPSAIYENGTWHLWLWDNDDKITKHYSAKFAKGPYTFMDECPRYLGDYDVVKSPVDGSYFAGYKNSITLRGGVAKSKSLNGPWQDLGYVFTERNQSNWHLGEEADGSVFFYLNKVYFLFAGWDGVKQRIGIAQVDAQTMKALTKATCLLSPKESWQKRNNSPKVFNPVGFIDPHNAKQVYVYYSQNPSAAFETGWGYIRANVKY
jgi:hypothetical protein